MNNQDSKKVVKESVEVLSGSPDVLKLIITSIPQIMFWKDTHSVFMGCNPSFTKLSGVSEQDIVGKTDFDLIAKDQAEHMQKLDQKIVSGELNLYTGVESITTPKGLNLMIDLTLVPLYDQSGVVKGVLGSGENITEKRYLEGKLKYSEEKYRNLIEFTKTGYVIMDSEMRIIEANQTFVNILGADSKDIIGRNPRTWVDSSDVQKFDKAFESLLKSGRTFINDMEIDFYDSKTKRQTSTAVTANVIENGSNKIFCLVRDISARRTEEQKRYISDQKSRDRIKQNIQELRNRLKEIQFR